MVNEFAEFFLEKIQKIQRELEDKPKYQPMRTAPVEARVTEFKAISEEEVDKIIMFMKTKQCELDTIPTHTIKEALPQIKLPKWLTSHYEVSHFQKNMEDCISQVSD